MNLIHRNLSAGRPILAALVICVLALAPAAPLFADQVGDLIGGAGDAYKAGNLKKALELLSRAITDVQNQLSLTLAGFLPGEMEGWERGIPEFSEFTSDTGGLVVFGNLFSASVAYTRVEGDGRVTVTLTNQPELTGIARANLQLLENPFFRERVAEEAAETGQLVEAYTLDPLRGMRQWRDAEGAGEISLFVGEVLLQAEGSDLEGIAELEAILGTTDLQGLGAFAAGNSTP